MIKQLQRCEMKRETKIIVRDALYLSAEGKIILVTLLFDTQKKVHPGNRRHMVGFRLPEKAVPILFLWLGFLSLMTIRDVFLAVSNSNQDAQRREGQQSTDTLVGTSVQDASRVSLLLKAMHNEISSTTSHIKEKAATLAVTQKSTDLKYTAIRDSVTEFRKKELRRSKLAAVNEPLSGADGNNGGDPDAAESALSGFLQAFKELKWLEEVVASRLDVEQRISHQEKRAWRQRVLGQVVEVERRIGTDAQRAERIDYLERKSAEIMAEWGKHFGGGDAARSHQSEIEEGVKRPLTLADLGTVPRYRPVFEDDAIVHESDEEGRKLHLLYNKQER